MWLPARRRRTPSWSPQDGSGRSVGATVGALVGTTDPATIGVGTTVRAAIGALVGTTDRATISTTVGAAISATVVPRARAAVGRAFLGRRRHVVIVERHELLPRSSKATPERARETVLPDDHSGNQSCPRPKSATLDRWTRPSC